MSASPNLCQTRWLVGLALALVSGPSCHSREAGPPAGTEPADEPPVEGPADGPDPLLGVDVLVHGQVTVHPKLTTFAPPGGTMEIRVMDLRRRRPALVRRYEGVQFPLAYEFRRGDAATPAALDALRRNDFYVDVGYVPPASAGEKPRRIGGEAWGTAGKPVSIRAGATADVALAAFARPALYEGQLAHAPDALLEGWVMLAEHLRKKATSRNRLVVLAVQQSAGGPRTVLAGRAYEDVDPRRPLAFHLAEGDFVTRPVDPAVRVQYEARLDVLTPDGLIVRRLHGTAGPAPASVPLHDAGARIALDEVVTADPFAALGFDASKLRAGAPTYE